MTEALPRASAPPRLLRNYLALTGSNVAAQLLNFAALVYLARVLGLEVFGQVSVAQTIALYLRLAADMGLEMSGTRCVSAGPRDVGAAVGRFLGHRLVNAAATWLLASAVVLLLRPSEPFRTLVLVYAVSVFPLALLLEWAFAGLERMGVVALSRLAAAVVNVLLVVTLVRGESQVLRVPLAFTLGLACSAAGLAWLFRREHPSLGLRFDLRAWRTAVGDSLTLGLSFITIQAYYSLGTLLLGALEGSRAAGLYSAPQRMVFFLTGLAGLLGTALYPRLVALRAAGDRDGFEEIVEATVRATLMLGLPLAVGGMILAPSIIATLYGPAFSESASVLRILVWQAFTVLANVPFAYALLASGRQRHYFRSVSAGAALNLGLNLVLIPRLAAPGAAAALLASDAAVLTALYVGARRVTSVHGWRPMLHALPAAGVMAALLVFLVDTPLWGRVGAGALAYGLTLWLVGGVTARDGRQLWKALRGS